MRRPRPGIYLTFAGVCRVYRAEDSFVTILSQCRLQAPVSHSGSRLGMSVSLWAIGGHAVLVLARSLNC